uniref:Uncharacterized protein n=1 Tax=Hyaloperonospora arabidopsidis (strain Emoy2) TaxID=559515 RepID=M4BYY7_HYAAE
MQRQHPVMIFVSCKLRLRRHTLQERRPLAHFGQSNAFFKVRPRAAVDIERVDTQRRTRRINEFPVVCCRPFVVARAAAAGTLLDWQLLERRERGLFRLWSAPGRSVSCACGRASIVWLVARHAGREELR